MTLADSLFINSLPSAEDGVLCYAFSGSVDAHSARALGQLSAVPANSRINLDFKQVERVNSMGLSLLLKLFEQWERQGIKIEVNNPNRMVAMLFKITGLSRFLKTDVSLPSEHRAQPAVVSTVQAAPDHAADHDQTQSQGKLNFMASLQVGAQLSGWYLLNTYLQRRLQRAIHFEQLPAGHELADESVDILFAKPFEACAMVRKRNFAPLLRPTGEADEVVIVMRANDERQLGEIEAVRAVTASQGSFVYLLGRFLCDESGLDSSAFQHHFAGNEIKALQMLLKEQADVLFMLKKTYWGLSNLTRNSTRVVDESDTQFAFHLLCVSPQIADLGESLTKIFTGMNDEEQGKTILKDIQFEGWCAPQEGEIAMLMRLFERYAEQA
jgi:anti-anti-sigma factor